ncbi:PREDICTED: delta and Notch-like epidermal growth factor-related receptor, partial [Galeopterus variegatus]|uniref:Delta and Notch-like epidermal growth factor-related receptor n=1 Tax=Galeopterus variegatus TaxID=482537 RepID=A0ABM0Q4C6_GALVR
LVADPCASNPCHHGNCSSSSSSSSVGYLCICNEGYEGPDCQQALPSLPASGWTESMAPRQLQPVPVTQEPDIIMPRSQATVTLPTWQPKTGQKVVEMKWDQVEALPSLPASGWTESVAPRQLQPVPVTQEPDIILPRSQATVTLPTWQPKTGQKVVEMKWDQVEVLPDIACGNASSNSSAGGRLVSFEVPQNTSVKIRQDATASLILLWKVTAAGFQQCSLVDGRSVTPLQAPGGLVLLEEMLTLGHNHFIGEL